MIKGTKREDIENVLKEISLYLRTKVKEVTVDVTPNMHQAIKKCFPRAESVIDRFHVQKLAHEAVH